MLKNVLPYVILILLFAMTACQKGIHWEFDSEGTLEEDSTGNCMPVEVAGTFVINKTANDSNFLLVSVNVTAKGNYSITTDSINGIVFKASGVFTSVGIIPVKLACSGTPLFAGTNHYNIYYNSSICEADILITSDTIAAAEYTLQGSPNACMNDTVRGVYLSTVVLDTANEVVISVNVIKAGKYSISTNTVNGYSFSGNGVFINKGIQSVIIKGIGTPKNTGNNIFIVNANNNTCSFSVPVSSVIQTTNPSHFPLTAGSYWEYDDLTKFDTVRRSVNGDTIVDNRIFVRVTEISKHNSFYMQNLFYNYDGGNYNQFQPIGYNYYQWNYSPPIYGLMPILKEYGKPGDLWGSQIFTGKAPNDFRNYYYQCTFSCVSNNAIKTVNGLTFKDVIIIAVYPLIKADPWIPGEAIYVFGGTNNIFYSYYAKGVGLIYFEESDDAGASAYPLLKIIDWKVN